MAQPNYDKNSQYNLTARGLLQVVSDIWFFIYFYVCVLSAYNSMHSVCAVPLEARRGHWIP